MQPYGPLQQTTSTHYPGSGTGGNSTSTGGAFGENSPGGHSSGGKANSASSPKGNSPLAAPDTQPSRDASIANAKSEVELPPPQTAEVVVVRMTNEDIYGMQS